MTALARAIGGAGPSPATGSRSWSTHRSRLHRRACAIAFALAWGFAPGRGLVAHRAAFARQRLEFAQTMLKIHLANHEGRPEAAVEPGRTPRRAPALGRRVRGPRGTDRGAARPRCPPRRGAGADRSWPRTRPGGGDPLARDERPQPPPPDRARETEREEGERVGEDQGERTREPAADEFAAGGEADRRERGGLTRRH